MRVSIRPLTAEDGEAAAVIFFDAVQSGTADVYSAAQREAWAGQAPDPAKWRSKFERISGFAADVGESMAGFMTMNETGYIDLAFVKTEFAGQGIGQMLYRHIEDSARMMDIGRLTTEASRKAEPFFLRLGWQVDQAQTVFKAGVSLTNFKMSKQLEG